MRTFSRSGSAPVTRTPARSVSRMTLIRILLPTFLVAWFAADLRAQKVPDENFTLTVEGPSEALRTGTEFEVRVLLTSRVAGIDGWALAIEHDPATLELLDARFGLGTRTANDGGPPEYLVLDDQPAGGAGVTLGAILTINQSASLDIVQDFELLVLSYRVVADPDAVEPCVPVETAIRVSENLGNPVIRPRISVEGQSSLPLIVDAPVTVRCPGGLEFVQCEGGRDTVDLAWQSSEEARWDFLFIYRNGDLVDTLPPEATSYQETGVPPGRHDYTLVTFIVEEFGEPIFLFAQCSTVVNPVVVESLEPGLSSWIGGEELTITGASFTVPQALAVSFSGVVGSPSQGVLTPVNAVDVVDDSTISILTPEFSKLGAYDLVLDTEFGPVTLENALEVGFVRGEVNSDGLLDISDVTALFEYLFLGTAPEPRCLDSADATDDGILDMSDGALVLAHLFLGTIDPPAPFPAPGQDPTLDDPLDCLD